MRSEVAAPEFPHSLLGVFTVPFADARIQTKMLAPDWRTAIIYQKTLSLSTNPCWRYLAHAGSSQGSDWFSSSPLFISSSSSCGDALRICTSRSADTLILPNGVCFKIKMCLYITADARSLFLVRKCLQLERVFDV